jgi:uncharacterized protein (TIGR01244 family)
MPPVPVTQKLWVMPQPSIDEFKNLRERGFVTVINNRPDREDSSQPSSAAKEDTARAAALSYVHIPVTSTGMTAEDARRFQAAVEASPGPVVAHCRTGARSFFLWIMAGDIEGKKDQEVLALADQLYLDPKAVADRLALRRASSAGDNI